MDRKEYNDCISPWIKGKGIDKEERKLRFCVGAKICSKKAKDEAEATTLCNLPKEPKAPKKKRGSKVNCEADMKLAAQCLVGKVNVNASADEIYQVLLNCRCGKKSNRVYVADMNKPPDPNQAEVDRKKGEVLSVIAEMQHAYGTT